jgi:hypothetical protein
MHFRVVRGQAARNPVARAIARKKVHDCFMAAKIHIYLTEAGVDDSDYLGGVMSAMTVVGRAVEIEYEGNEKLGIPPKEMPVDILRDTRVLRGALSALVSCWKKWDPAQAVAIEQGIDAAERLNKVAKTEYITQAGEEAGLIR